MGGGCTDSLEVGAIGVSCPTRKRVVRLRADRSGAVSEDVSPLLNSLAVIVVIQNFVSEKESLKFVLYRLSRR